MPSDYLNRPRDEVRYAIREITDEQWIKDYLKQAQTCTLATQHDGQPFVNMNLFVYDEQAHTIYMHTAQVGRTKANIEANPPVCFSVHEVGRLLPDWEALEMSVEYSSVVVFGRMALIEDAERARHALQQLLDKYFTHLKPGRDYRPITEDELARTAVYAIDIETWSAKRKKVKEDFPGAFFYGQPPAEFAE